MRHWEYLLFALILIMLFGPLPSANSLPEQSKPQSAWNIRAAVYDGACFNVGAQDSNAHCMIFSADGSRMYMSGTVTNSIYEYSLAQPWNLSSASYSGDSLFVGDKESDGGGITFSPDGKLLFLGGDISNTIWEYRLPTPWRIAGAEFTGRFLSVARQIRSATGPLFSPDGRRMYVSDWRAHFTVEYRLDEPWNISTASVTSMFNYGSNGDAATFISPDGRTLYSNRFSPATVFAYALARPWDLSTASSPNASFSVADQDNGCHGVFFRPDGRRMFMLGYVNGQKVYPYSLAPRGVQVLMNACEP